MSQRIKGIILSSIDYKENHRIIFLLTEDGRKSLLVRRGKDYKSGCLFDTQTLNKIEYEETSGQLPRAKVINLIDSYNEIKEDLKKMATASYVLEFVYKYLNTDFDTKRIYNLINSLLLSIQNNNNYDLLLLQFKIKMLYFLGIQPNFKTCIHCGTTSNLVGLSIQYGSMECVLHQSSDNIGIEATNIFRLLYLDKTLELQIENEQVVLYLSELINKYYESHLMIRLKSKKMLEDLNIII